jgi:hypothetical protein
MPSLKEILLTSNIPFKNDKIFIDPIIKHIKIDVGLAYNAPQSQKWLENEEDLLIFAFEPNPEAIKCITDPNNKKRQENHGDPLNTKYINKNIYIIPVALTNISGSSLDFYVTDNDDGCSSLLKPKQSFIDRVDRPVKNIIKVPGFTLKEFFELLPLDTIDYIEYIKSDAQGSDLNIIMSGSPYIQDKVVYVTLEAESNDYEDCEYNNTHHMVSYMDSIGFVYVRHPNTDDPTFINKKFLHLTSSIFIYQKG